MDMDSPEFRAHIAAVSEETSPKEVPEFNRLSHGGWRYRKDDPLRPIYVMPEWGPQEDGNWRWHHQSLALTGVYVRLHQEHHDPRAIPMLEALVDDWAANSEADPVYSWRDHTTALRLKRLVRLFGTVFDELSPAFRVRLLGMIEEHCHRLLGDVARSHHNHALDQVYAVVLAHRYFPFLDIPVGELARRLGVERDHLLADGVVTENSPGYQSWIPQRIDECQRLLTGQSDSAMLETAAEFAAWIARPDGTWPEFGDTLPGKAITPEPSPRSGFRSFPAAGYAVYRDDRAWSAVKCGFLSHAHRHADDGSFLLMVDGEDVFIEAGMFGYTQGWQRAYSVSAEAHNVSYRVGANVIRSTTSRRWQRNRNRWGMSDIDGGVRCRSFMFDDATYTRSATFGPGQILLRDSFDSPGPIRTRFHVPDDARIEIEAGRITVGPATLLHDLANARVVVGHRTIGYMAFGDAQVIELDWPEGRTEAAFEIRY